VILGIPVWGLWTIAAALLAIGEVLTPGLFFLGPLAVVAVFPALLAAVVTGLLQAGDQVEVARIEGATALVLR
jgi:membrane protein implicated in regulation of membrane protease activity